MSAEAGPNPPLPLLRKTINRRHPLWEKILFSCCVFTLLLGSAEEMIAAEAEKPLIVDIEILAPCVMASNGRFTGFDIDLWEAIAQDLNVEFTYRLTDLDGIFKDLLTGKADVGFSCITITSEREELLDFSHHYLDSGLRILVLNKTELSILEPLKSFLSPMVLSALTYLGLFIIVCGNIVWLVERGHRRISRKYFPGIFESIWFVVVTMATVGYGDVVPRKWVGRLIALLVMVFGIGFFGWVIAQLSSAITLQKLQCDIDHPQDLRDKVVATVEGTTSVPTLNNIGAMVKPVKTLDQACQLLLEERVEAVVFDSPAILHYERNEGAGRVKTVGPLFDIQYYGFIFPHGSELREHINRSLLRLRKNGTYNRIYTKWFGIV